MTNKHIPQRMCIVCRKMFSKDNLVRFVVIDNKVVVDKTQKMQGRGFWLCKDNHCISELKKKKVLNRILKREVPNDTYDEILEVLNG